MTADLATASYLLIASIVSVDFLFHILKTPNRVSGMGALRAAEIPRPRTVRVCAGGITPSSQRRAVE